MLEKLFLLLVILAFGWPLFFVVYSILFWPLKKLCSLILRFFSKLITEENNDRYSTNGAHAFLFIFLYVIFLFPLTAYLTSYPDWLPAVLVVIGIAFYFGLCYCLNSHKDKNALQHRNASLLQEIESISKQNNILQNENAALKQKNQVICQSLTKQITAAQNSKDSIITECESLKSEATLQADLEFYRTAYISNRANIADMPKSVYFINGCVPVKGEIADGKPFGEYTVYVAKNGKCYHADRYCSSGFLKAKHLYETIGHKPPCQKCASGFPTSAPEWYFAIKNQLHSKKEQKSPLTANMPIGENK